MPPLNLAARISKKLSKKLKASLRPPRWRLGLSLPFACRILPDGIMIAGAANADLGLAMMGAHMRDSQCLFQ